jgi:glycosyltransferase involved in cell wall biosynthesis
MDDPPFEFDIIALSATNTDNTLASRPHQILGDGNQLWGTNRNNIEFTLNLPRAARDLWVSDYDVIHVLTFDTIAYPLAVVASARQPVIGPDIQGYVPGRDGYRWNQKGIQGLKHNLRFRLRKGLSQLASDPTFVALSQYQASNIASFIKSGTVEVMPPGVDRIFHPGDSKSLSTGIDRKTKFLYVGDLSAYKGYDLFLEALTRLPSDISFEAEIIGSGNPHTERIAELGLTEKVTIHGFVDRKDLPHYYRDADFYVMPSVDENGPNTIVEALACGTPVLATNKPGINEYAPEAAAEYFERNVPSIRDSLVTAHENRDEYQRAALQYAEHFTAERTISTLEDIYTDHISQ